MSDWNKDRIAFLPLMVDGPSGKKILITESDLMSYPGMFLYNSDEDSALEGFYAEYPKVMEQGGYDKLQMLVKERHDYIAKFDGATSFPWRVVAVSENDVQMADNDLVWKLATPAEDKDWSWVKPGKVAWDWWNNWNLYGVDFRAGINNDTYKYFIDFASEYGIEYVILDDGWAVKGAGMLFAFSENAGAAFSFLGFEGKEAGYIIVFAGCSVAYLFAWVVMKLLVPVYKKIED